MSGEQDRLDWEAIKRLLDDHEQQLRESIATEIEAIDYRPELEHGDNGTWMQEEAASVVRSGAAPVEDQRISELRELVDEWGNPPGRMLKQLLAEIRAILARGGKP